MPKFLISDCDYTLVDFNHEGGIEALRNHAEYTSLADPFDNYFQNILQGMRTADNEKFAELKTMLEDLSNTIVTGDDKLVDAVWSRELWAYHYLMDKNEAEHVRKSQEAADIYWHGVGTTSAIYEDTPLFVERLRENEFYVVLVTSSDGRLTLNKEKNEFVYLPSEAKRLKTERYQLCGFDKLFDLNTDLHIGDPVSKPHQVFWEEALRESGIDLALDSNHIVVIGDSYDTDIKGAEWFKSQSILLDRNEKYTGVVEFPAADHVAHNLEEALQFIL